MKVISNKNVKLLLPVLNKISLITGGAAVYNSYLNYMEASENGNVIGQQDAVADGISNVSGFFGIWGIGNSYVIKGYYSGFSHFRDTTIGVNSSAEEIFSSPNSMGNIMTFVY